MFKNLLKAGMTFFLLLGGYYAYGRAFEFVVQRLRTHHSTYTSVFPTRQSKSKQQATALARESFGSDHWSVTSDHLYAYYNAERGFWMFALDVEEIQEENGVRYDGKRLKMKPFAMIWNSSDRKSHQMLTAEKATLDMNQPIGLSKKESTEAIKVEHALIEQNVRIRDERGTPGKLSDDMVGTMDWVRYDEETQKITTASHVVFQDPDQTTIGDGMLIQLTKQDPNAQRGQSSSGFGGAKFAILDKNVHVRLRDMGDSGVFPGAAPKPKSPAKGAAVNLQVAGSPSSGKSAPTAPAGPSPMDILSDGPMHVDFAKNSPPVEVGPPEPPAPTFVRFERNVVALFGHPGLLPDQLNCDTLRLTLVPPTKPTQPKPSQSDQGGPSDAVAAVPGDPNATAPASRSAVGVDRSESRSGASPGGTASPAELVAQSGAAADVNAVKPGAGKDDGDGSAPAAGPSQGPFGNLTLQRAHATGHAVWLQLREQGAKVRCNELIHERRAPYEPDMTYFRGDVTRPMWLEKIDREPVEPDDKSTQIADGSTPATSPEARAQAARPKQGKITGVTHVVTLDATLLGQGNNVDLADIIARGPGKLESRPDLQEPVERIAVWQDELRITNILGPDSQLLQKQVVLTGTRPYFVDVAQKTSLDSGESIYVWLEPSKVAKGNTTGSAGRRTRQRSTPPAESPAMAGRRPTRGRPAAGSEAADSRSNASWPIAMSTPWPPTGRW